MGLNEDIETVKKVAGNPKAKATQQVQHTPDGIHTHDGTQKDCEYCTPPGRESSTLAGRVDATFIPGAEPHQCSFPVAHVGQWFTCVECQSRWICIEFGDQAARWKHAESGSEIQTLAPYGSHVAVDGTMHSGPAHPCEMCDALETLRPLKPKEESQMPSNSTKDAGYDSVNPPHYQRGPEIELGNCDTYGQWRDRSIPTAQRGGKLYIVVSCIQVMRHIKDPRLATALRYMWRVAFGGKRDPKEVALQRDKDVEDIKKAIWYLQDFVDNPTE